MPTEPNIYTRHNLPPVIECDCSNKVEDVYGWEWCEAHRQPEPVVIGQRDPQAEIDAARMETLTEMMARVPGKNPVEKLCNAVNAGILAPIEEGTGKVVDVSGLKADFVENANTIEKGAAAYKALKIDDAKGEQAYKNAIDFYQNKLKELEAAQAAANEAKGEQK